MIRLYKNDFIDIPPIVITLDRFLRLDPSKLPDSVVSEILEMATHEDPVWKREKVKGYQVSEDDRYLFSYRYTKDEKTLLLARGLLVRVQGTLSKYGIRNRIVDDRISLPECNFTLRDGIISIDYQDRSVTELLKEDFGILDSSCGSGKTVMMFMLLSRLRQPTLVVVNTIELLNQWADEATKFLNISRSKIGKIGGGDHKIRDLTIATFQSLNNFTDDEWRELNKRFGCIIIDESHHAAAPTIQNTLNKSRAKHRYGVTATLKRKDGREFLIFDAIGDRVVKVDDSELEDEGRLVSASVEFIPYSGKFKASYVPIHNDDSGEVKFDLNWGRIYSTLADDDARTGLIVANVVRTVKMGHNCLVLSSRVAHCEAIFKSLKSLDISSALIVGHVDKDDRKEILKKTKNGDVSVLVATNNIAAEGLDVPCLSCLHLTMPTANPQFLKQATGRIRRVFEDKLDPLVVDYTDLGNSMLFNMGKSRAKTYSKFGYRLLNDVKSLRS